MTAENRDHRFQLGLTREGVGPRLAIASSAFICATTVIRRSTKATEARASRLIIAGILGGIVLAATWSSPSFSASEPEENLSPSAQLNSGRGETLFAERCAICHEHPRGNIPPVYVLNYKPPEAVVAALTTGPMQPQARGLTQADIRELAIHLTHRAPGRTVGPSSSANHCRENIGAIVPTSADWNGVGLDLANTRFQENTSITRENVSRLKLKWAFAYPGGSAYGTPVAVGGTLFVSGALGGVFALDSSHGCTHWTYQAEAPVRSAIVVGSAGPGKSQAQVYFGDEKANIYALSAKAGKLVWKVRADDHPLARITGSPMYHAGMLYVPVSSMSEGAEWYPNQPCCTFRGSVVAIDALHGRIRWKTYMIPREAAALGRNNSAGTSLSGPAGAAIWAAPTLDVQRHALYVATGNAYNDAEDGDTNAVVALNLATGQRLWAVQPMPADDPYTACRSSRRSDCEKPAPEHMEFGDSPILRDLGNGHRILVIGQKSGVVYGLDPDHAGNQLWQQRIGKGGLIGGVMYGGAADAAAAYFTVADRDASAPFTPGGTTALRLRDGKTLWHAQPLQPRCYWGSKDCSAAQPGAVTAIPDVVFAGALDGHIRAFSTSDGKLLWDADTGRPRRTVNGAVAAGGSINGYPQIVSGGTLYVTSGSSLLTHPGSLLLAFTVEGR